MSDVYCCFACGSNLSDGGGRFCPWCGAKLDAAEPEHEPFKAVAKQLRTLYDGYQDWVSAYFARHDSFAHSLAYGLGGKNSFYKQPEHQAFFDSVVSCGREMEKAFKAKPDRERELLMDMLSFGLLECYESCPGEAAWMYRAVEQVYRPFIPCLSAEEADRLYLRYKALRKRDPGLSVQTEILKALKKQRT